VGESVADRRLELGGLVADDPDLRGLDAQGEQRAREERAVEVGTVAADELRARDDDRGAQRRGGARAQAACPRQPAGVIVSTQGR